jgi:hypothetical protein
MARIPVGPFCLEPGEAYTWDVAVPDGDRFDHFDLDPAVACGFLITALDVLPNGQIKVGVENVTNEPIVVAMVAVTQPAPALDAGLEHAIALLEDC